MQTLKKSPALNLSPNYAGTPESTLYQLAACQGEH